jgi:cytochrome b6-f complex iron-sulfur subunit
MRRDPLPTLPAPPEDCPDCTRRLVVQTLGAAGAAAAASVFGLGCGGGDDGPTPDAGDPLAGTMMCGANLCVLLGDPANVRLADVDGSRLITLPGEKLLIVRTAADDFVVLSATCTHQGCTVGYLVASKVAACPCHGSRFSLSGAVTQGPATQPLGRYSSTYDAAAQTLTIML